MAREDNCVCFCCCCGCKGDGDEEETANKAPSIKYGNFFIVPYGLHTKKHKGAFCC